MKGFAGGAVAGVVVGAAALAGLSLAGFRGPVPERIGVVAAVGDSPVAAAAGPAEEAQARQATVAAAARDRQVIEASAADPVAQAGKAEPEPRAPARAAEEPAPPASASVAEAAAASPVEEAARPDAEVSPAEAAPDAEPAASVVDSLGEAPAERAPEPERVLAEAPALPGAEPLSPEQALGLVAPEAPGTSAPRAANAETVAMAEPLPLPGTAPAAPVAEAPTEEVAAAQVAPSAASALPGRVQVGGSAMPGRDAVRVNRPGAEAPAGESEAEVAAEEPVPEDAPALRRYAAAWEAPAEAKPRLALVLLDDGATDPQVVAALPWPVSVALDPTAPDAAGRLAAYRAAGVEALVLARLPEGAQPVDLAGGLGESLARLPETVAVLDLGEGGLAGRNATAQMAMAVVAREGRGVVLGDDRLGAGLALAGREGIPAAELLRDLDGDGQDGAAILRGLDDTVRRAGQEGRGIVLARVKADTLAALAEWSREGRADDVTVAPVSAVLGAE